MNREIRYGRQSITENDVKAVSEALRADYLTTGPRVQEFEERFAQYVGAKFAVAVANGTAALHLSALALEVNESSKVITSPITFAATANCIKYCNGEVEFCDIDSDSILLDINEVREKLKSSPKGTYAGIIPIDFAGNPVNMEEFRLLADEYDLWIIEDSCHAPGGWFMDSAGNKQYCGNGKFSDLAIFSFHPVKHITCGEGGMITTDNEKLYNKLKILRSHGITSDRSLMEQDHGGWYYEMITLGYNYRLPDILCALGISQLERAHQGVERRNQIAVKYDAAFRDTPIRSVKPFKGNYHAYHLYVIEYDDRNGLYKYLRDHNIYAQIHYIPIHTLPYYKDSTKQAIRLPKSENYYEKGMSLPMYPTLSDEEQEFVIDKIMEYLRK